MENQLDPVTECTQCGDKTSKLTTEIYQRDKYGNGRDKPPTKQVAIEEHLCQACTEYMDEETDKLPRQVPPKRRARC